MQKNTITHRGCRKDNGKSVRGNLLQTEDGRCWIVSATTVVEPGVPVITQPFEVDPSTVCRSTEQTDKNGLDIFEQDVVYMDGVGPTVAFVVRYGEYAKKVGLAFYYGVGFYLERIGDPDFIQPLAGAAIGDEMVILQRPAKSSAAICACV